MDANEFLKKVLEQQTLSEDSDEVKAMEQHRDDVEKLLLAEFEDSLPDIEFGGSRAKGTMIKDNYDIDIICYFPRDDADPGDTLKEIYESVRDALSEEFTVEERTSALRLKSKDEETLGQDFHIDVVPGRYVADEGADAYLHVRKKQKKWLKTNLHKHIAHISKSKAVETIRLAKVWNCRSGLSIKTFVLELLVRKALDGFNEASIDLAKAIEKFWTYLVDNRDDLKVEDPANPTGNDLTELIDSVRDDLCDEADRALQNCQSGNWEKIFGSVEERTSVPRIEILNRTASMYSASAAKPWADPSEVK